MARHYPLYPTSGCVTTTPLPQDPSECRDAQASPEQLCCPLVAESLSLSDPSVKWEQQKPGRSLLAARVRLQFMLAAGRGAGRQQEGPGRLWLLLSPARLRWPDRDMREGRGAERTEPERTWTGKVQGTGTPVLSLEGHGRSIKGPRQEPSPGLSGGHWPWWW